MYDDFENGGGGGGGGGQPRKRGTSLAVELDRKLAGDEYLGDIIDWWDDSWRARARLYVKFVGGNENIRHGNFSDHPDNFSDNESAVHMVCVLSGCGRDNNRIADLDFLWSRRGIDSAKLADDTYVSQLMQKFIAKLENARTELRNQQ
jgi:hypothetical protein